MKPFQSHLSHLTSSFTLIFLFLPFQPTSQIPLLELSNFLFLILHSAYTSTRFDYLFFFVCLSFNFLPYLTFHRRSSFILNHYRFFLINLTLLPFDIFLYPKYLPPSLCLFLPVFSVSLLSLSLVLFTLSFVPLNEFIFNSRDVIPT